MKSVVLEYPESLLAVLGTDASHFAQEAKMAAAMKLFERGRFSSGQAAEFAGVSRAKFLLSCGDWGVSSLGPWDEAELEREFATVLPPRT